MEPVGRVNLLLLLAAGGATLYACWSLYVTPLGGVRIGAMLPLILASGVLVNRLVLALQRRTAASRSSGMFARAARWASTLIMPLVLAAVVNVQADVREQRQIAAHFAPLLDFIDRSIAESGRAPGELSGYAGFDRARLPFTYLFADDRYMVLARGGSIDIDGSIVFFDSATKSWSRIHNDQMQSPNPSPDALQLLKAQRDLNAVDYP